MKYPAYFFWLCLLAGINFGIFSNLTFFGAVPNLFLLFVIFSASLKGDLFERLFTAFLCGLFADYWNGGFFWRFYVGIFTPLSYFAGAKVGLYACGHGLEIFYFDFTLGLRAFRFVRLAV